MRLNRKALLIVVLLMHLTVHPLAHALAGASLGYNGTAVSDRSDASSSIDECSMCRVASALTVAVLLALLFAPRASGRLCVSVSRVALPAELLSQLPSRAPPLWA